MRWVYDARVPPPSTRARALGLARRLAAGALGRLAREVDRISRALEPLQGAAALRPASGRDDASAHPIEITSLDASASRAASPQPTSPQPEPASPQPPPLDTEPEPTVSRPAAPASTDTTPASSDPPPSTLPSSELTAALGSVTHLRQRVDPLLASLREADAWPEASDPARALHQLRVATRRLRAFVRLFAPVVGAKRARKVEQSLRTITRALGPARELDVLLDGLRATHASADPVSRAALEHVMAWAEARRRKAARKAHRRIAALDVTALADALDAALDRVCERMLCEADSLPDLTAAWLEPELTRTFEGMPRPSDAADLTALHDARIHAKRLRYVLELLRPRLDARHLALLRGLKHVQGTIGAHRDAAQLHARLAERRTAAEAKGLPTLAQGLAVLEAAALQRRERAFDPVAEALEGIVTHEAVRSPQRLDG